MSYPPAFFEHDNLCRLSDEYLLVAVFVSSKSGAFPLAMRAARQATLFAERDLESMKVYVAGFVATAEGAVGAIDLLHYIRGWRGTRFYTRGRMILGETPEAFQLEAVFRCFTDSCGARDYRAHCFRLIDNPFEPLSPYRHFDHISPYFRHYEAKADLGVYVFPCQFMLKWFRAQKDHPASIPDQIQAEGISKMCDVCPRFDPDEFGVTAIKNRG